MRKVISGQNEDRALRFEDIEREARRGALLIAARLLESMLNADTGDYRGQAQPCPCGGIARYRGRRGKTFITVLGDMTLTRAYYYCPACKHGFFPRDRQLALGEGMLSAGVRRMVGMSAALVSFQESHQLLDELAGLNIETRQVERVAEALGQDIARDERSHVGQRPAPSGTMYLGLDGTGIPMRQEELKGRPGKQVDGSSRTREMKLVTTWTADGRDKEGIPVRDEGSVAYNAAIESAATADTDEQLSDFARRVGREGRRTGYDRANRQVLIGDGAKWIWSMADELFPRAIQIVDLYHAKGTVSEAARKIFGLGNQMGEGKAKKWRDLLEGGDIDRIIDDLGAFQSCQEAEVCIKYLQTNRERMRYPLFREVGLCTSSGVVEAGCKVAIGTRLKRAGMHWTLVGANAISALRCSKLSDRFDGYWLRRRLAG